MSKSKPKGSDPIGPRDRSRDRDRGRGAQPPPLTTLNAPTTERLALRKKETAQTMGVSERMIHSMVQSGELPSFKMGRVVLIPVEGIKAYMEARTQKGGQA